MTVRLLTRRLRPVDLYVMDAVLAVLTGVALCGYAALESPLRGGVHEPAWASVLTGLAIGLPIAVRRRWPVPVAIAVTAVAGVTIATGIIPDYAAAAPAVAIGLVLYTVAARVPLRPALATGIGCLAVVCAALASAAGDLWSATEAVAYGCVIAAPAWLLGWTVQERRAQATRLRDQMVRQAAAEERLRVARELHDIVAHTMNLIVVKAAVANHVADQSPQETRAALQVIEATGRGAMREMRRVLGMLRDGTPYDPQPGLDDLPRLAEQASMGGADVRLDLRHDGGDPVPESLALAVYRIVQEAVTNVVKHAAPATCHVRVHAGPDRIDIEVADDGRRPVHVGGAGHGLIGMRERAALHGGTFTAGPRAGGGFTVTARLPRAAAPALAAAGTATGGHAA
ncbi:sensor histidine kinase [Phytohabitans houttuyneae]|uniref:histidine kinase n=1 Tax=Phytohabitans houttuyneae TaxID=1076126 RepID=A0A6V8KDG4_9ACTN|nr:sensor histidine kinase [Phytohabitans houttuyneae]GFJ81834.1 two-component sensor histidine kinase [Phytohabitans houttuyneae]